MATVGLSFGSATSGAGFNVSSTVASILAIESGVETPWKAQLSTLQGKDTAFTSLGTNLSTLGTALQALTNADGDFTSKEGSSSNTGVLALTSASSSASAGSHTVVVSQLASTATEYTSEVSSASATLSGSFSFTVGSGATQTITLDANSNTLTTLASTINAGSYGVTASVISDANGSRLELTSSTSGAAGAITMDSSNLADSNGNAVSFNTGQTGQNAQMTVDGIAVSSASNTVTNAINGVTFQLLEASPGSSVQVEITNDVSTLASAVQSVVTAYNAVVSAIRTQEGKDSSGNPEPLFGDPTLSLIQTQLSQALYGSSVSGSISNINQLGLSVGTDGSLTLDAGTLESELNDHYNDVEGFFQSANSFGANMLSAVNQLGTSSTTGALSLALAQDSTQEAGLNADISNEELYITQQQTYLTGELTTANEILQSIPNQLNEVDEMYSAITGYNEKG